MTEATLPAEVTQPAAPPPSEGTDTADLADMRRTVPIGESANQPEQDDEDDQQQPEGQRPEGERTAEHISRETQAREINMLGETILTKATNAALAEIKTPQDYGSASESARSLFSLDRTKKGAIPIDFRGEPKPIQLIKDGKTLHLASLDSFDGTTYSYTIIKNGNPVSCTPDQAGFIPISLDEIVVLQQDAYKDAILSGLADPNQRKVVEIALTAKTPADLPEEGSQASTELNTNIKAAAREAGIFTTDDVRALAEHIDLSEADKESILALTRGNILSPESFKKAMEKTDIAPKKLAIKITAIREEIEGLRKLPQNEQIKLAIKELQDELHVFNQLQEIQKENGPLEAVFAQIQTGEADTQLAKGFIESFRSGQMDEDTFKKFGEAFPGLGKKPGESHAEWQARMTKKVGMVGLFALIVLLMAAQTVQAVGPQEGRS